METEETPTQPTLDQKGFYVDDVNVDITEEQQDLIEMLIAAAMETEDFKRTAAEADERYGASNWGIAVTLAEDGMDLTFEPINVQGDEEE